MQFDTAYKSQFEGDNFNCMLSGNTKYRNTRFEDFEKISEAQNLKKQIHM
jgi:hypothetical protein